MIPAPSPWLFNFLKQYEQFRPTAYAATKAEKAKGIWTKGYGHTYGVKEGDTCTMAEALELLDEDVVRVCAGLKAAVKVPVSQNQADALYSITFNAGYGRHDNVKGDIADSTLLIKLNAGDIAGCAAEFAKWNKQDGRVLDGLTKRRAAEAAHFTNQGA